MRIITTDCKKGLFWAERTVVAADIGCGNLVKPYPSCRRQEMKGFGGAFTEAAGYCYGKLPKEKQEEFIQAYFGDEGLRYNLGRTHINSCDFALENYDAVPKNGSYNAAPKDGSCDAMPKDGSCGAAPKDGSCDAVPGDGTSGLDMERANKYVLPLVKDAMRAAGGQIAFLLSPWSPPGFMKTNGEMNHGGSLKPQYRRAWADYIAKYLAELKKEGMPVRWLTVQNEPEAVQTWDSCVYHAKDEMEFARDYLHPALVEAGLGDIKILVWDHNKEIVFERADDIFSDERAAEAIYGIAVHWYTGDHFQGLSLVREAYPQKEIFFTEGCVEYSRFMDSDETAKAEMYAHDMIGNFNNYVSAFFDWNLLLDAGGGPNHVGNFCAAPVMLTEDETDFEKRLSYYYIGHFSRYVERGAVAVPVTTYCSEAEACAFVNPSGGRVLVLLNRSDRSVPVSAGEGDKGAELILAPHTITTLCYEKSEIKK